MNKVTPKIKDVAQPRVYDDLKDGEFFICEGNLWVKYDFGDQNAVCVGNNKYDEYFCDKIIVPVDVEIKWTLKVKKGTKK